MIEKEFELELKKWFLSQKKPLFICFELTHRCNFKCVHCYLKKDIKNKELSFNEIKKALDEITELKTIYIGFTGGEIFMRKDIIPILQYTAKKNFLIQIKTNGSLITKKIIDKIKNLPITKIEISLYGASKETYKKITGNGNNFNITMNALSLLKKTKIPVTIVYVPLKENLKEAYKIKEMAKKKGFVYGVVPYLRPKENGNKKPLEHSCSHIELMDHVPFFQISKDHAKKVLNRKMKINPNTHLCGAANTGITINPYGNVHPYVEWKAYAGNIRKNSIKKIWYFSKKLKWIRSLRFKDFKDCKKCEFLKVCMVCPAKAFRCKDWYKKNNLIQMQILRRHVSK